MMFNKFNVDERSRQTATHTAYFFLHITQLLLAGVLFYRLYILGQPDGELWDLQLVLAFSIFGYMGTQLYLGGVLPVLNLKGALIVYGILVTLVAGISLLSYGVPPLSDWSNTWLPAFLGPAILVGLYALLAWLGKRRLERLIEE
ncbi:hypothetical protein ACFL6T_02330 [Candidatus Zixiibacteriota bacterium]